MADETSMGGKATRFRTTLWDTVEEAQGGSEAAIALLAEEYWKPVYFFIRRRGHGVEEAKDLTQAYFATFLEKDYLRGVARDRGRFRAFIMSSVSHFVSDARDRSRAVKRGGRFNFLQAENDLAAADASPEKAFFKGWALTLLERVLEQVRKEAPPEDFALLEGRDLPGIEGSEKKNRLHRLRVRLREHLRESLRRQVETESDIDAEVEAIFAALGSLPIRTG